MKRLYVRLLRPETGARCFAGGCTHTAVYACRRAHWSRQGTASLRCSEHAWEWAEREQRRIVVEAVL